MFSPTPQSLNEGTLYALAVDSYGHTALKGLRSANRLFMDAPASLYNLAKGAPDPLGISH